MVVPDYQLSLAIGKEGQNARLAARLTGWRIDIRSDEAPADDVTNGVRALYGSSGQVEHDALSARARALETSGQGTRSSTGSELPLETITETLDERPRKVRGDRQ